MKKQLFAALSFSAIALVGCKKEDPVPVELGTAVVSGTLRANLDLSNDVTASGVYQMGLNPEAVAGVQVSVTISTSNWDLNPTAGYSYPTKTYTATTDANGNYSLSIPANTKSFGATVVFGDVIMTQTQYEPNNEGTIDTKEVKFSFANQGVTLFAGTTDAGNDVMATEVVQNGNDLSDDLGSHQISGTVYLNNDTTNDTLPDGSYEIQYEAIPAGTMITVNYQASYNAGNVWQGVAPNGGNLTMEIPVNTDGTYSATLPTGNDAGDYSQAYFSFPDLLLDRKFYSPFPTVETEQRVYQRATILLGGFDKDGFTINQDFTYNF